MTAVWGTRVWGTRLSRHGAFSLDEIERAGGYFAALQFQLKPNEIWYANTENAFYRWTGTTWVIAAYGSPPPIIIDDEPPDRRGYLRNGPPARAEWVPVDGGAY